MKKTNEYEEVDYLAHELYLKGCAEQVKKLRSSEETRNKQLKLTFIRNTI
jgi:hypothetical protein